MPFILITLSLILIVLCLLMMVGFGIRALVLGRKNYIALGSMALAGVVFLIAFAVTGADAYAPLRGNPVTKAEAAIVLTAIAMFGIAILALVGSAVRGFFS